MHSANAPVYQVEAIRQLERLAEERFGIHPTVLMARAGKAAFDLMVSRFSHAKHIAVFCGGGNNGGDGYVLAELAMMHGMKVEIYQVGDASHLRGAALAAYQRCQQLAIPMVVCPDKAFVSQPDLIVDAICGIGAEQDLRQEVVTAIDVMTSLHRPVLAIDIPTGIHADTGMILGAAIRATVTVTFIGLKLGLLTGSGLSYAGEIVVDDLQFPPDLLGQVAPVAERMNPVTYQSYLKPRWRDWHKGLSGHVLVIGGAAGFTGAARMAAMAALRVGAGLVTIATDTLNAPLMNIEWPELMCHGVKNGDDLEPLLQKADVVVIGPGLGQSDWALSLWQTVKGLDRQLVVDADGLNLLADHPSKNSHWVLTPHPGEAGRLLQKSSYEIQQNRLAAVKEIVRQYEGVAVLKGAGTLVAADDQLPAVCDKGNPGMATAGMGDILSGVIGGLLAQGVPGLEAAQLGVMMHAMAGDMAAKEGERGMIATDLFTYLRRLSNTL